LIQIFFSGILFGGYSPFRLDHSPILKTFPTKQKREERWVEENLPNFLGRAEALLASRFPTVLARIIIEYANLKPTLLDV
jgi:hypothetical protein